jgi:hypothetical protein
MRRTLALASAAEVAFIAEKPDKRKRPLSQPFLELNLKARP